jgi:hypothetical protein
MTTKITRGPSRLSASELKRVGITVPDKTYIFEGPWECDSCGGRWIMDIPPQNEQGQNRMPRGYWICPHRRCNAPEK